ncbi:hypothetical protein OBBRIDRAFT_211146 [Obba rivulosa]|uniref:Uncharacterized protein n=1 Tax=Obba rivulosa TaxID=1052685 RepID=A0A8E2AL98_9APHY|nr:hypothetical protein OBBRIDRAFT_211146 [Obba rivulosa]
MGILLDRRDHQGTKCPSTNEGLLHGLRGSILLHLSRARRTMDLPYINQVCFDPEVFLSSIWTWGCFEYANAATIRDMVVGYGPGLLVTSRAALYSSDCFEDCESAARRQSSYIR